MTASVKGLSAPLVTATELFVPTTKGEASHLPFATVKDAMNFSEVSPACAAIVETFFAKKAEQLRGTISSFKRPMTPEHSILREHFQEAEAKVTRAFPSVTPEKRDVAIAKLFFSTLSYSMQYDAPLVSKPESLREFIQASQDQEPLKRSISCIDAYVKEITSHFTETKQRLTQTREQIVGLLEFISMEEFLAERELDFPGISEIWNQFITGIFTRPTEEVVRAKLAHIAAITARPENEFNRYVDKFVNAPEALIQGVNNNNILLINQMHTRIFALTELSKAINLTAGWNQIKDLPSDNPIDSKIRALRVREFASALCNLVLLELNIIDRKKISFKGGEFTQVLPEMAEEIQRRIKVGLENNRFRRVPHLPPDISELSLAGNPLTSFENLLALPQLKNVNFANTGLHAVPLALEIIAPRLSYINLANNNLIEVPESFSQVAMTGSPDQHYTSIRRGINLSSNPIIYIPPLLVFSNKYWTDRLDGSIALDMIYQGKSSLAKLYHYFIRPTSTYNREEAEELLAKLSPENRNLVYQRVKVESGELLSSDMQWGERHVFDDLSILARAVRSAILTKLETLPEEEKHTVYRRMNNIAGSPEAVDVSGGRAEKYAKDRIIPLADALSLEVDDTPPKEVLIDSSYEYLAQLARALSKIHQFNREYPTNSTTLEPAQILIKVKEKLACHDLTPARSYQRFRYALRTSGAECPYCISSLESRIAAEIPDFCKQPKEVLEAELVAAKEAVRIIKRADYLGTDYDAEIKYISEYRSLNSSLGSLITLFTEGPFKEGSFYGTFGSLSIEDRTSLLRQIWNLSPDKDMTLVEEEDKLEWAMEHRLSDLRILGMAAQLLIIQKYNGLSVHEKNKVDMIIYNPPFQKECFASWVQTHTLDSLSRVADAMHERTRHLAQASLPAQFGF